MVGRSKCKKSYIKGMVAAPDSIAAMQGHHIAATGDDIPRTLFLSDESSSVPDSYYTMASTWANRAFIFGNTWECNNFFKFGVRGKPGTEDIGGDLPRTSGKGYYRRIIKITAEDSPNVKLAIAKMRAGQMEPDELLIRNSDKPWGVFTQRS